MRFAEADAGMNVKRVEHHRVAAAALSDLTGRCMRKRVRAADDEGGEGVSRGSSGEPPSASWLWGRAGVAVDARLVRARLDTALVGKRRLGVLHRYGAAQRRAHGDVGVRDRCRFGLPALQHAVEIVRRTIQASR